MKRAKKLTAILLCIAMLLGIGATSAFALEIGDTVEFSWYDTTEELIYKGVLNEGINEIEDTNEDYYTCYTFEADKDGYYMVTFPADELTVLFAGKISGNKAELADHIYTGFDDEYGVRYFSRFTYLTKGTALLYVHFNESNPAATTLDIEYYAEKITDINYDEETVKYLFKDSDGCYVSEENKVIGINAEYSISFSNGKTIEKDKLDDWLECSYENKLVTGENTVTMLLPGYEKEITIGLYETSDFVESVEIPNAGNYLDAEILYNGQYLNNTPFDNEKVTITFKDGTKETVTYVRSKDNYVTFPCGKKVHIYADHTVDDRSEVGTGKYCLYAQVGYTFYKFYECNVKDASFAENFEELRSNISRRINHLKEYCDLYLNQMLVDGDFVYWIGRCLSEVSFYTEIIFGEISDFIDYYI